MSEVAPTPLDLRCSMQARLGEVRPIGTAVPVQTFALLELPLPWPPHFDEHPSLEGVEAVFTPLDARLQGVVPSAAATASGRYRATLYLRRPGPFRRYERIERSGGLTDVLDTCRSLVSDAQRLFASPPSDQLASERELLVCTHGSRDRCCGSMGTVAFASIDHRPDLRLARTSHLGGHRFAPTAAVLPEGTAWAWLDADSLAAVLDRSVPVAELIHRYRGSTAMDSPVLQAAEAAVFAEVGWGWLDATRSGEVVDSVPDGWSVRIDSSLGSWTAEVVNLGDVPQPVCGSDEPSTKSDPQLEVTSLERAL